jgi:hypothetical protein
VSVLILCMKAPGREPTKVAKQSVWQSQTAMLFTWIPTRTQQQTLRLSLVVSARNDTNEFV